MQPVELQLVRHAPFGRGLPEAAAEIGRVYVALRRLRLEAQDVVDEPLDVGVPHAPHLVGGELEVGGVGGHGRRVAGEERSHST